MFLPITWFPAPSSSFLTVPFLPRSYLLYSRSHPGFLALLGDRRLRALVLRPWEALPTLRRGEGGCNYSWLWFAAAPEFSKFPAITEMQPAPRVCDVAVGNGLTVYSAPSSVPLKWATTAPFTAREAHLSAVIQLPPLPP